MLDVILPGTGGTMPLRSRWLASAYLRYNGRCILIDCGEGTQIALRDCGCSLKPIDVLCLTHFHADHVSGLPGFLLSMGNDGRTEPLTILGPPGCATVVGALRAIAQTLPFEVRIRELCGSDMTFFMDNVRIRAFPVRHTTVCYGYTIAVNRAGKFDPARARAAGIPLKLWSVLQKQPEASCNGIVYTQDMVLGPPRRGLLVCYAVDTRPLPEIVRQAEGADLFICEGMYGDPGKKQRAVKTGHMTIEEAARMAAQANPEALWLTHYSPSMPDPETFLERAKEIFPKTVCGRDGMRTTLRFPMEAPVACSK